ncbi:MAG: AzlD domain-containing protein [Bacteroidales bacterium]|nr:AzlD domain-containing protein [Bacteroidales bacterium]
MSNYAYILVMFLVTITIRVLPLTLIRCEISNRFMRSFLYYVPYVTLSVMTFPAIMDATNEPIAGALAFVAGVIAARLSANLFKTAAICCAVVLVAEMIL